MNSFTKKSYKQQSDDHDANLPQWQAIGHLSSWDASNSGPWVDEAIEALDEITVEKPGLKFPKAVVHKDNTFYEFHFSELLIGVQDLVTKVFGSGRYQQLSRKHSPWVPTYPNEFYEHVKAVAHPDPNARQWELLLQRQEQRTMLVSGIIWKALHANVLNSLLFGADKNHEEILSAMEDSFKHVEGKPFANLLVAIYADRSSFHSKQDVC